MVQNVGSIVRTATSIGVGGLSGLLVMVIQVLLPPQSYIKRVLTNLNWPVDRAIDWYARAFHGGNTDQVIPQGAVMWGIYWVALGVVLGFGVNIIWLRLRGR
jgi:hypothetical protein